MRSLTSKVEASDYLYAATAKSSTKDRRYSSDRTLGWVQKPVCVQKRV
jgi:hypothetical protein